ncbi:MAG: murein hydrolase activator EnvC family protein [Minisyncoccota bacterium]
MKKFLCIGIVFLSMATFVMPTTTWAQTNAEIQRQIEATKRERDALLEQQRKIEAELQTINAQGQTLQGTVESLDATRAKLANDLKITQSGINKSNLTIQKLENDIGQNENEIESHKEAIRNSLTQIAVYDRQSVIFDLLGYKTMVEAWNDVVNLASVQSKLNQEIGTLEKTQVTLLKNKSARELQKTQLLGLSNQLSGQKKVADETRTAQAKLLAETKAKEAEFQKILAENKARQAEFEKLLFQFESQLQASNRDSRPIEGRGVLSWPLDNVYITQFFGKTSASSRLYVSGTHNGMDFRASVGTRVLSVADGIVSGAGNTDNQAGCYSYGRWILIRHNNGLSSLYAHLSGAVVSPGQTVLKGQVIGYSGGQPRQNGSGFSTGPHLHLGLYATAGVQVLPYSSSINCKNVSVPLANPQDYLDPMAYLPLI